MTESETQKARELAAKKNITTAAARLLLQEPKPAPKEETKPE